ncbi:MAG: alpha/beta hydrolase [Dehalococcoidia bacterium]|nr:alpha/beta hydrolase [Dehalococcoidia bacterium]
MTLAIAGCAALWQALCERRERKRFPPPGSLVDVGGHRLHAHIAGTGSPTVIFESGLGCPSLDWCLVQPEVAKFTATCSYDRAGIGWSQAAASPRLSHRVVGETHTLLRATGAAPPYVLVGHSAGGLLARVFAERFRDEVVGMVLVDASCEGQDAVLEATQPLRRRVQAEVGALRLRASPLLARLGVLRAINGGWTSPVPPSLVAQARALGMRGTAYDWVYGEMRQLPEWAVAASRAGTFGDMPLIVLTASRTPDLTDEVYAGWHRLQRDLTRLSSNASHIVAARAGHLIHLEEPELVTKSVKQVVDEARARQ